MAIRSLMMMLLGIFLGVVLLLIVWGMKTGLFEGVKKSVTG